MRTSKCSFYPHHSSKITPILCAWLALWAVYKTASPSIHVGTEGDVVCYLFRKNFLFFVKVCPSSFEHNLPLFFLKIHTIIVYLLLHYNNTSNEAHSAIGSSCKSGY